MNKSRLFLTPLIVSALAPISIAQYSVSIIAGGGPPNGVAATSIALSYVNSIAIDTSGNHYIPSSTQNRVYRVAPNGTITIVAGDGTSGYSGDNLPAASAQLNSPNGVAVDGAGDLYIADSGNYRIRKVSGGVITTVAGNGIGGYSGDFGPATNAQISYINSIAADSAGNLYVADSANYRIRKVSGGVITTVAGNGISGYFGDGGPATSAQISFSTGVAADSAGNLYIADSNNARIRKVFGGVISTVAGNGIGGYFGDGGPATSAQIGYYNGVAADSAGNVYIADSGNNRIRKVSGGVITTVAGNGLSAYFGDGGPATSAQISFPTGVVADSAGNLYIADRGNYRIRKVSGGVIATVAGNGSFGYSGDNGSATSAQLNPAGLAVDSAGNLYVADSLDYRIRRVASGTISTFAGTGVYGYSGDNVPATSAQLGNTNGVAVDGAGNVYIADGNNYRIRKVAGGFITTVAGNGTYGSSGDGGPATNAQIGYPAGLAVDSAGNLFFSESNSSRVRKVSGGVITTVAGAGPPEGSAATSVSIFTSAAAADSAGNVYFPAPNQNRVYKLANGTISTVAGNGTSGFSGDNGPAASAQLNSPSGVAVDSAGALFIADSNNARIRKVSGGVITTVAGNGTYGYSGDGGLATSAQIGYTTGVAADSAGNFYIADSNNARIRKVSGGVITTVAGNGTFGYSGDGGPATSAQIGPVTGVAADSAGNLYIGDASNARIRKVSGGVITTVAGNGTYGYSGDGGPATSAQISYTTGVAADSAGNLYIGDASNNRIRKVSGGVITTVAGNGVYGYSGDGGPATSAQISFASGVAADSAGNLFIADSGNYRLRKVSGGVITTVAGNGLQSYSGDGGQAISAQLNSPSSLAVDISGNLYIADSANNRVRVVSSGGTIATFAGGGTQGLGDGGLATNASLSSPRGLAVDAGQNVYIGDSGNRLLRKVSGGVINSITTYASIGSYPFPGDAGIAVDSAARIYVSDPINSRVRLLTPLLSTTTVVGTISPEPSAVGQTYSVAYTVTSGGGTPTGSVTVTDGIISNICTVAAGVCSIASTTPGLKTITVSYAGSGVFAGSFGVKSHTVYTSGGSGPPAAVLRDTSGAIRLTSYASATLRNAGGVFASDADAAEDSTGNVFATARDNSNSIWTNVFNPNTQTWAGWQYGAGVFQGTPAITVAPGGTAWISARDPSNSYWLNSYTSGGYGAWAPLAGAFSTDPAVTACPDGSIYVVGKDASNSLWSGRYIPGTGFQGFQLGGGGIKGKPSVSCGLDNAIYISARDNFNSNWIARVSGNTWTGWFNGGAAANIDPRIATLGGSLGIVILDAGGSVWRTSFTEGAGNGWQAWIPVGGSLLDISPAGFGGQLYFIGRGSTGLWWWQQAGNQWTWIGNNGVAAGALSAAPR